MLTKSSVRDALLGIGLAAVLAIMLLPVIPIHVAQAQQAGQKLFSMTLLSPTSNPARRQWAAIISQSFQSVGIDARLVFVSFGALIDRVWGGAPGLLFDKGGYDAIFIGWGGGGAVPDLSGITNYRAAIPDDVPPTGNNYAFYNNSQVNQIMLQYNREFDPAKREQLAQQLVRIVANDRPYLVILYPANIYIFANYIYPWNRQDVMSASTAGLDFSHWRLAQGDTINVAITGDINNINPVPVSISNSIYDRYVYGPVYEGSGLKELDPRTFTYYNVLLTNVVSSPDHLTWTVTFRGGVKFHDSADVTADDFIFTYMINMIDDVGSVGEGFLQSILGFKTQYTFLNGTTRYVDTGKLISSPPAGWKPDTAFRALNKTAFTFTMSTPYVFTDPGLIAISPLPMHILEQIPYSEWASSWFSTLQKTPITITWDASRFGGNGSYAHAVGPIGAGAWVYQGYDATTETATLVRYDQFWNASGLQALGEFNAKTIHIRHITEKDAALAAFANGEVNFLDTNYSFRKVDRNFAQGHNGVVVVNVDPSSGWQELGLNLHHPVYGTGVATPLGQKDPSKAADAARFVRAALSYLIPRQYIIDNLLDGAALPGSTQVSPAFKTLVPADVKPDPYDPTQARAFLAAAGYQTGVAPFQQPSTPAALPSQAYFIWGTPILLAGRFASPTTGIGYANMLLFLQESTDNVTWRIVGSTVTDANGYFFFQYIPSQPGTVYIRWNFTGYSVPVAQFGTVRTFGDYLKLIENGTLPLVLPPELSPVQKVTTVSLSSLLQQALSGYATSSDVNAVKQSTDALSGQVSSLSGQISSLSGQVSTLTSVAYAALAIAVILGIISIALALRRPGARTS